MHPDDHDVVGRIAEDLDVQRAQPAQQAQAVDAQQRGGESECERHDRRRGEDVEIDRQAAQQDRPIFPEHRDVEDLRSESDMTGTTGAGAWR